MKRWWELMRKVVAQRPEPKLAELDAASSRWDERATVDASSYRMARAFRLYVHSVVMDALSAPARARQADFRLPRMNQAEGVVWKLLTERPQHLLPPAYADWDALHAEYGCPTADERDYVAALEELPADIRRAYGIDAH